MSKRGGQTRTYFRQVAADLTIRVRFDLDRGRVVAFAAQLEVLVGDDWLPAVRYDSAHERPHRDTLGWDGRTVAKDWLPAGIDPNAALTHADRDLTANAERYRAEFERRKP